MAEEKVTCPANPRWLVGVYNFLGPELFMKSRLAKYYECIKSMVEKE